MPTASYLILKQTFCIFLLDIQNKKVLNMSSIKRTGFCYQVAYGFVPKNERPERVNICEFPWDFFVGILRLCFGGIVMVLGLTLTYLCGMLWGHRLKMIKT